MNTSTVVYIFTNMRLRSEEDRRCKVAMRHIGQQHAVHGIGANISRFKNLISTEVSYFHGDVMMPEGCPVFPHWQDEQVVSGYVTS